MNEIGAQELAMILFNSACALVLLLHLFKAEGGDE
jgi:hypothetical protein